MKVVVDTSTLIAALLQPGHVPGQVLRVIRESHELVVSPAIAAEYAAVLTRPKFDRLGTRKERQRAVQELVSEDQCCVVHPRQRLDLVAADSDDNRFLEAALTAGAHLIVSSDPHLLQLACLDLSSFGYNTRIPIMRPPDAMALLVQIANDAGSPDA